MFSSGLILHNYLLLRWRQAKRYFLAYNHPQTNSTPTFSTTFCNKPLPSSSNTTIINKRLPFPSMPTSLTTAPSTSIPSQYDFAHARSRTPSGPPLLNCTTSPKKKTLSSCPSSEGPPTTKVHSLDGALTHQGRHIYRKPEPIR